MIPDPMDNAYRAEMFAYLEKRGESASGDSKSCFSDLEAKEPIYNVDGVATSSTSASCGKVFETMNLKNDRNRHSADVKSWNLVSQKTEVNGEKTASGKNSEVCDGHASSSKEYKSGELQGKAESRATKPGIQSNCGDQVLFASQAIAAGQQTKGKKMQTKIDSKASSKCGLNKNGSDAGGTASTSAEFLAAASKKKIPSDVLADCSNRNLRIESNVGNGVSIRDIKNKLNLIEERKGENRPPNFIKRNILALKAPVIAPGTSRSSARHIVSKFSKSVKRN